MSEEEDLGEMSYREVQHKLKALGLPAKGPDKILRERLTEALDSGPGSNNNADSVPEVEVKTETTQKTSRKVKSPKVEVVVKTIKSPPSSPVKSPKSTRGKNQPTEDAQDGKDITASPGKSVKEPQQQRQSRRKESLPKTDTKTPTAGRRKSRVSMAQDQDPYTPLDKIKRLARDSTVHVRRSIGNLDKELKRRKISWKWILPPLLVTLLLASQWRHSLYWHRNINRQLESLNSGITSLRDQAAIQAGKMGQQANDAYDYLYRQGSKGADRLYGGLTESYHWALQHTPVFHHKLPEKACSARLDPKKMSLLSSGSPEYPVFATTLKDVWRGHKEDYLKATGVLLAGRNPEHLKWAGEVIRSAVPIDCVSCFLHLKGEDFAKPKLQSAGELQAVLSSHLAQCPYAIIYIEGVHRLHPEILQVLINALAEQGGFESLGKRIAANNALFIGSTQVPAELFAQAGDEEKFTASVKRDLAFQLEMRTDPTKLAHPEAFRRRWDYVAPILKAVP